MRLFLAVPLCDPLRAGLAAVQGELRPLAPAVRWVDPGLMHLTLVFLGELPEAALDPLEAAVSEGLAGLPGGCAAVCGLGSFGPPQAPRTIWAAVQPVSELLAAQRAASAAAVRAGATPESRPFAPHLTLGRSRDTRPAARLAAAIRAARDRPVGELRVDRVVLVESTLTPAGPVYHERRDWALAADAGLGDQRAPEDVAAGGAFVRLPLSAP